MTVQEALDEIHNAKGFKPTEYEKSFLYSIETTTKELTDKQKEFLKSLYNKTLNKNRWENKGRITKGGWNNPL